VEKVLMLVQELGLQFLLTDKLKVVNNVLCVGYNK
jgi:hypothetical protein